MQNNVSENIYYFIRSLDKPEEVKTISCFNPNVDISLESVAPGSENREGWGEGIMDKEKLVLSLETSSQDADGDL